MDGILLTVRRRPLRRSSTSNSSGNSRGEVSTAKHVYARLRSGWFSCRSACYLAAGRPAVIQDTGFSRVIPCGRGLLAFETVEEAANNCDVCKLDFAQHSKAARDVACECFEAAKVVLGEISSSGRWRDTLRERTGKFNGDR